MEENPSSKEKTIADIVAKAPTGGGIPSLSTILNKVLYLSAKDNVSLQDIAKALLQDYGLTTKTLEIVNSAYYGMGRMRISTVSRATILLGINTIKSITIGMLVLEHLVAQAQKREVAMKLLAKSFLTGFQARELAAMIGYELPEEAFICGMLQDVGRLIIAIHYPDNYEVFCNLLEEEGYNEYKASVNALGAGLPEISRAIVEEWKLPQFIWQCMEGIDEGILTSDKVMLKLVCGVAKKSVDKLCSEDPAGWYETLSPLESKLKMTETRYLKMFDRSVDAASIISSAMEKAIRRMKPKRRLAELVEHKEETAPQPE